MGRGFLIMGSSGLDGIYRSRHQPEGDGEKDREREGEKQDGDIVGYHGDILYLCRI